MRSYKREYGKTACEIVYEFIIKLRKFTYNEIAATIYANNYKIKLETIKRIVRELKKQGLLEICGRKEKEKLFCYVG